MTKSVRPRPQVGCWTLPFLLPVPLLAADNPKPLSQAGFDRPEFARYALANHGDAHTGRAVFADPKAGDCLRCHAVRGEGGKIGPDLSDVGGKLGREHLIE